jgi:hypothetical protein
MPGGRPQGTARAAKDAAYKSMAAKDPNAPKRPPTAYFMFMADERQKVALKGVGEIVKEIGSRWNTLDGTRKKKYQEKASKEKERYEAEMKKYTNQ